MTEQEFQTQVWRMYDRITLAEGVPGKVLGVNFLTKSVKAYISGSPEWVRCELIETHTSATGKASDDGTIIEELHNKVLNQKEEISRLQEEKKRLAEGSPNDNYLKKLLMATNILKEGLVEKKKRVEKVEKGLELITEILGKIEPSDINSSPEKAV